MPKRKRESQISKEVEEFILRYIVNQFSPVCCEILQKLDKRMKVLYTGVAISSRLAKNKA
jgi:hypothetical protein